MGDVIDFTGHRRAVLDTFDLLIGGIRRQGQGQRATKRLGASLVSSACNTRLLNVFKID